MLYELYVSGVWKAFSIDKESFMTENMTVVHVGYLNCCWILELLAPLIYPLLVCYICDRELWNAGLLIIVYSLPKEF